MIERIANWMLRCAGAVLVLAIATAQAEVDGLRIVTWNLEHLVDERGEGCIVRSEDDLDAIARRIEALGADIIAFQEVENLAAAERVFDPAKWHVVMSSRPDPGQGPTCWDNPNGRLQNQATGIALRRSVEFERGTDLAALGQGEPRRRWGTHVVVGEGSNRLHVLSVHLKSGCWGAEQDAEGRDACTVLRNQMRSLRSWIDERQQAGSRFAVIGDFNRRLAVPGDWGWSMLSPEARPLELATAGRQSHCDARYPEYIDHIVLWAGTGPVISPGSFREEAREGRHPDHCALSVKILD